MFTHTLFTATYLGWCLVNRTLRAKIVHGGTGTHRPPLHEPNFLTQVAHCLNDFLVPRQRLPQLTQCQGMLFLLICASTHLVDHSFQFRRAQIIFIVVLPVVRTL